jgi:hypothetical protein
MFGRRRHLPSRLRIAKPGRGTSSGAARTKRRSCDGRVASAPSCISRRTQPQTQASACRRRGRTSLASRLTANSGLARVMPLPLLGRLLSTLAPDNQLRRDACSAVAPGAFVPDVRVEDVRATAHRASPCVVRSVSLSLSLLCQGWSVVVRCRRVREAGRNPTPGSRRGLVPNAGPHVGVAVASRDGAHRPSLRARSGRVRSPGRRWWAGPTAVFGWIAGHSQHEPGDHGGEGARDHDSEDEQCDARPRDRDEGHDEQHAADDHEQQRGSVPGVELVLGGRVIGHGSMLRPIGGRFHRSWAVIDSGVESGGVGGEPAPERASRGAGRGAPAADRAKLAPKLDAADGQADERSGALLGLDRQS